MPKSTVVKAQPPNPHQKKPAEETGTPAPPPPRPPRANQLR